MNYYAFYFKTMAKQKALLSNPVYARMFCKNCLNEEAFGNKMRFQQPVVQTLQLYVIQQDLLHLQHHKPWIVFIFLHINPHYNQSPLCE